MKITKHNNFAGKSYQIKIELGDDLETMEIAESFSQQFPKEKAVITNSKIVEIKMEMVFVGLNLKNFK